jgi:murein DD-endopeptidase MepM/ murein hydrolase activator NlpD
LPIHRKPYTPRGRHDAMIGDEPPLVPEGVRRGLPDRREVSGRWLAATFVTGFAGFGLMGGALWAAVDGDARVAVDPNPARAAFLRPTDEAVDPRTRKGDRLQPRVVAQPTRQILQVATATRVGDREIVRTRPFARVSAGLVMDRAAISSNVPPFNPLRVFAEAGQPQRPAAQPTMQEADGEMSVAIRPIDAALGPFADEDRVPTTQLMATVRQAMLAESATSGAAQQLPQLLMQRADQLRSTSDAGLSTFFANGRAEDALARVTNENVTAVTRTESARPGGVAGVAAPGDERVITVQRGQSLATILVENGATLAEARTIIEAVSRRFRPTELREGQRVRIALAPTEAAGRRQILRVAIVNERQVLATAVLTDQSQFAAIDMSLETLDQTPAAAESEDEDDEVAPERATPTLYASLYETALRQSIPRRLIEQLVRIYAYDFDFQRRVRPGDSFEVFYSADDETGGTTDRDDILYASLTVGNETRRYFRFQTEDDGVVDYYDERGRSAKQFLLRTPINGGTFRSGFGMRRHPLLGYSRMHTGVDWSAPVGTPIVASGVGTVVKAQWDSGYGRRIEVQHANGYMTTYSHLSGFARGIQPGARVFQGQVIGFLGSSGLSTGPHLHYEVLVNGSFVDPMRIRLPRGRTLGGRFLADFERERIRIETMMRRSNEVPRVAQVN